MLLAPVNKCNIEPKYYRYWDRQKSAINIQLTSFWIWTNLYQVNFHPLKKTENQISADVISKPLKRWRRYNTIRLIKTEFDRGGVHNESTRCSLIVYSNYTFTQWQLNEAISLMIRWHEKFIAYHCASVKVNIYMLYAVTDRSRNILITKSSLKLSFAISSSQYRRCL